MKKTFLAMLELLVSSYEITTQPHISEKHYVVFFTYKEKNYLLNIMNNDFYIIEETFDKENGYTFFYTTKGIYDDNKKYIGSKNNSLLKSFDFDNQSPSEFLNLVYSASIENEEIKEKQQLFLQSQYEKIIKKS